MVRPWCRRFVLSDWIARLLLWLQWCFVVVAYHGCGLSTLHCRHWWPLYVVLCRWCISFFVVYVSCGGCIVSTVLGKMVAYTYTLADSNRIRRASFFNFDTQQG